MEKKYPQCSLILTVYNQAKQLELVFRSIQWQSVVPNEIIIADDGSSDNTSEVVENWRKILNYPIKYLWHEDVGFTKSIIQNRAVISSSYDYIIFIDGDIMLHEDFIKNHLAYSSANKFLCGHRGVKLKPDFTESLMEDPGKYNKNIFSPLSLLRYRLGFNWTKGVIMENKTIRRLLLKRKKGLSGGNFSLYKEAMLKVNGFDQDIVQYGYEDYDLGQRLKRAGYQMINVACICVGYHLYHATRKVLERESLRKYFDAKSEFKCKNGIKIFS